MHLRNDVGKANNQMYPLILIIYPENYKILLTSNFSPNNQVSLSVNTFL